VPFGARNGRFFDGDKIPVEGTCFPQRVAPTFKPQSSAILDALARIEGGDGAPQHVRRDAQPPGAGQQLKVDPGAGPERARSLDEGTARAQIDERHGVAWPEDRLRACDHRMAEARVGSTIG
jgi:hypothetical protein